MQIKLIELKLSQQNVYERYLTCLDIIFLFLSVRWNSYLYQLFQIFLGLLFQIIYKNSVLLLKITVRD